MKLKSVDLSVSITGLAVGDWPEKGDTQDSHKVSN